MLRHPLSRIQSEILLRPRRVLVASGLLLLFAILSGAGVEFRTSRSELAPPDDVDQQRWDELVADYRGSEALIACVEAEEPNEPDAAALRDFADRFAERARRDPRVASVFHALPLDWFRERFFFLLPPETLERVESALKAEAPFIDRMLGSRSLVGIDRALAERIDRGTREESGAGEAGGPVLSALVRVLEAQARFLADPRSVSADPLAGLIDSNDDGYLRTRDGKTLFVLIHPRDTNDDVAARRALIGAMRDHVAETQRELPGFRVAFTGQPALAVEEMDTVRRDTWRTSIVAVLGVTVLTFLVFRWRAHAIQVLVVLGIGIAWAFGAVRWELGYLNLITSSFISTLVGIGVAYGIHPVSEYELEGAHTVDPVATLREAFHRTGAAVTVAGVTTSAAFLSIQLMRFRGFGELGLVAGVGVLLCLAAAMITLPALLVTYGQWRRAREREGGHRPPAVVDRWWVERAAGRVCRYPAATTSIALGLTLTAGWAAAGLEFDANILDLLPREAESLRYQRRIMLDSDLSPLYNIVVAEDLDSLRRMRDSARSEPTIERFDSVLRFLPEETGASRSMAERLREILDRVALPVDPDPIDRAALLGELERLEQALALAADSAFGAGLGETAALLEEARGAAESARETAESAGPEQIAAWNAAQDELWARLRSELERLRRAVDLGPPSLGSLPEELRQRFTTGSGRLLGFLFPVGSVFETAELRDYVAASRRVAADATGFPLVFLKMVDRITGGFRTAVLAGALIVAVILWIDYRNPRDALLALAPLVVGVIWMMGGMRLLGISFNFANLVAIPLIIGVGIDNGVHVVHRMRLEGSEGMSVVLRHTGRAILIASLTTMIGFGSLGLASHRGLSSLGIVLFLGVGSCLLTSTVVLPNLLVFLGIAKR